MKIQLFLITLLFFTSTYSQNLYEKIGNNAVSVFGINGSEILQKVSLDALNKSPLFDEMMNNYYRGGDAALINKIEDFGIDYSKPVYYVEEAADQEDVSYRYLCYHIKDFSVFEDLVKNKMKYENIEKKGDLNVITYNYYNQLYWNDSYAFLVVGKYVGDKFNYYSWTEESAYEEYTEEAVEEVYYYDENAIDTITADDLENMTDEEWQAYLDEQEQNQKNKEDEELKLKEEKEKLRQERVEIKQRTISNAILNRAKAFFSDALKANGDNLKTSFDPEADAFIYYSGTTTFMDLLTGKRNRRYPMNAFYDFANTFNGDITANFYLNETTLNMNADIKYPDKLTDAYAKMFKSKLNKKFMNYISNDDIGYMTYSLNSEELWNAYPAFLEESFSLVDEGNEEEWSLISDVIRLVVDEEALANAITGDAVFILNGLSVKNVTYTSWEYDEEYNYNSTEKTKEELVPDFTILFGSLEVELIDKILRLSVKNKILREVEGGYQTGTDNFVRNSDYFVSYSNGIVIFTNTHEKLLEFNSGGVKNKISGDKAKQIKKNPVAMYLNTEKLVSNLIYFEGFGDRDIEMINSLKEDMSSINARMYFSQGLMKFEATANVPSKFKNGAEYLLHLIDNGITAMN